MNVRQVPPSPQRAKAPQTLPFAHAWKAVHRTGLHADPALAQRHARAVMHVQAAQQGVERREGLERNEQREGHRLVELIGRELAPEAPASTVRDTRSKEAPFPSSDKPAPLPPAGRAEQSPAALGRAQGMTPARRTDPLLAMVERVEAFVRAGRPGLTLTLEGGAFSRVEMERVGPKEVSLRIIRSGAAPAHRSLAALREELSARGIKLRALLTA